MKVSIISTVRNEGDSLQSLLDSLVGQTRLPDEVVICDGGSTDNTLSLLETYQRLLPLRIISAPNSNISQGRNQAISIAAGPIIASVDGGVVLAPCWLEELVRPIEEAGAIVVSGWFEPDPKTPFEVVMGATVLPELSNIDPDKFMPSSRSVAYLKSAWQAVGGYPDWLDFGEDLVFDLALRDLYGPFPFAPKAVAYFQPRGTLSAYARQYYLYARGDGKANLWPKRHAIRYFTYLIALPILTSLIWKGKGVGWVILLLGGGIYCRRPAQRLWSKTQNWTAFDRIKAFSYIPLIRLVGDVAKMAGYPIGVIWRWRRRWRRKGGA